MKRNPASTDIIKVLDCLTIVISCTLGAYIGYAYIGPYGIVPGMKIGELISSTFTPTTSFCIYKLAFRFFNRIKKP